MFLLVGLVRNKKINNITSAREIYFIFDVKKVINAARN